MAAGAQALVDADFAIDPTDPHFPRLKQPRVLMSAVAASRKAAGPAPGAQAPASGDAAAAPDRPRVADPGLASLVGRVKRKQGKSRRDR